MKNECAEVKDIKRAKEHTLPSILYSVWLTCIPGIGITMQNRLLDAFGSAEAVYHADGEKLAAVKGMGSGQSDALQEAAVDFSILARAERIIDECSRKQITIITGESGEGKKLFGRLASLGDRAPTLLYVRGAIKEMTHTVGIVGARRCTQEDKIRTAGIAKQYTEKGFAIVSGMAKGIDSYAQTACLHAGGYTIAVLGNGPDICYPREHILLMESIAENGLLVSEYPPGTKPAGYRFPQRNRIIAGLSDKAIVIAEGKKSGAAITAEWSQKLGREAEFI